MLKITKNQGSIQVTADKSGFYPFDGTITFPTNSLFTATSANTDMITFKSTSNGDVQFVGNYKDITISGRSYDTKQKFLTAFSNLANQGSVDAYTKAETDAKLDAKQGKLKAGNGITLTEDATDNTTVVKTAVSLTDNGNGAYQVGDSIEIDSKSSVRIGKNYTQSIEDMTDRVATIAIGYDAETNTTYGKGDIAIGDKAQSSSTGAGCIAIGKNTLAVGDRGRSSIVIGSNTTIDRNDANGIAIGSNTTIEGGQNLIVIGNSSDAWSSEGVVIGYNSHANCRECVSIGSNRNIQGDYNVAIGQSTGWKFGGKNGIAIGYHSNIGVPDAAGAHYYDIAIGDEAYAMGTGTTAIGRKAEASDETPLVINAGFKTVDGNKQPLTILQSDSNGKLSILKGDGTDERIVIQDALSAGGGGTVDAYTKTETDNLLNAKQNTLTAGSGITIDENNVISSTGGSGGSTNPFVNVKGTNGDATIADSVTNGIAIGSGASVTQWRCVAIGDSSVAEGDTDVVIGNSSRSIGNSCVVIGDMAESTVKNSAGSVVVGANANSSARYGLSIGQYAEANDTTPLVINAGVDGNFRPLTILQSDSNGKLSILKGDGTDTRMVIQDEIEALKNAGGGGTVDAYTKAETDTKLDAKQDKLTAGSGITITKDETAGTSTIATAVSLTDNGEGAYTVGSSIEIGSNTVAIGTSAASRTKWSIAIGNGATSGSGGSNIAIGDVANSSGGTSIAIGKNAVTSNSNATAIGTRASAGIPKSIAIGYGAKTSTNIPMVINAGDKTMFQGDANGKISIPLGDGTTSTMCLQDEIAALKAEIAALKGGASTGA